MELFKLLGKIVISGSEARTEIDETTGKASSASEGIAGSFKKIGTAVATYFTVDAIKEFGLGCIQAAADAQAMESQFSQVFGDLEGNASKSLSGIASEAGISENRMKGSFTKIAAFAKTTGMDTESALSLSERAMVAVADSAAFYDRSLEDTTESLQSFLKGNYENDAALGLSCTETTRNAAANALYGKSFNKLSESQKQLTLLKMVEDANKASGAIGQAARESDTWTNVTGNLQQAWTDFQAVIGDNILPLAVDVVKKFAEVVQGLSDKVPALVEKFTAFKEKASEIGDYIIETFKPAFDDLKAVFEAVKEAVQPFIDALSDYFTSGQAAEDITTKIKDAIDFLGSAYSTAKEFVQAFVDGLPDYVTNGELVEDITTKIKDAVGFLKDKIDAIKEALQPYIDKLSEYVESGQAAEDITNAVETAVELLSDAYETMSGLISDIVQGFKDAVEWGKQHETSVLMIATAFGTLTAAIGLYSAAQAIKNAGGIAELAQLALLQVQIWGLTAAETAHTAVTTVATAVTSAFGAVLSFITSPITLVVLAIGALIAIGVALYKNWDVIKEKCIEFAGKIKEKWDEVKEKTKEAWNNVKEKTKEAWNNVKDKVIESASSAKDKVSEKWNSIKSKTKEAFDSAKEKASSSFESIASTISDKVSDAYSKVKDKFDSIKEKISDVMESAKETVSNAIEKLKGFFDFDWSLPKIKLPHFTVSGGEAPWGFGGQGSLPSVGVSWYKKAMDNAMILDSPTIFGYNAESGRFLGGGEAGSEVVSGANTLMEMIQTAVKNQNGELATILMRILDAIIALDENMGGNLREGLSGTSFEINKREFARLVKAVN